MRSLAAACAALTSAVALAQSGEWVLTFMDDFEGTSLNTSVWGAEENNTQDAGHAIFINSTRTIDVSDGILTLSTIAEPYTFNNKTYNFTSAWIDSGVAGGKAGFVQQFGRWEARVKMPSQNNTCVWPAFWLLPSTWAYCWPMAGELDIFEWVAGFDNQQPSGESKVFQSYHWGYSCYQDASGNTATSAYPNTPGAATIDYSNDWHVIGAEINATSIRWYVDNSTNWVLTPPVQGSANYTWGSSSYIPDAPMKMILNGAVATWGCPGNGVVPMEGWSKPAQYQIDWVKVWQWRPDCPTGQEL